MIPRNVSLVLLLSLCKSLSIVSGSNGVSLCALYFAFLWARLLCFGAFLGLRVQQNCPMCFFKVGRSRRKASTRHEARIRTEIVPTPIADGLLSDSVNSGTPNGLFPVFSEDRMVDGSETKHV